MVGHEVEILLVEDNPNDLELTLHTLRQHHLANTIEVARDGEEAMDFLFCRGAHRDRPFALPRVVLLDLKLPKIDGIEVLEAIRKDPRTAAMPVVVLTSSREQQDVVASYRLHVNSYIQKPVNFDQFQETIRQLGYYWLVVNEPPPDR
jgi:two-component system, response regulator